MKKEMLESISEHFTAIFPLFHKKILGNIPADKMRQSLSPTNINVLIMLCEMRSATVTELSNQLKISRPNMTPLIDRLVQLGLADRKTREDDRRVIQINITPDGEQFCREMNELFSTQIKSRLQSLEADDLTELKDCLVRLKAILIKINT